MSDSAARAMLASYDGRPICPRCSDGLPVCADFKDISQPIAHEISCATYEWADDVCKPCERAMEADR